METSHAPNATVAHADTADRYLRALDAASAELLGRLTTAALSLPEEDDFSSAAATHRRLTRQFLDGQRALLRQRANAIGDAASIGADALAAADAIVREAYAAAGIERPVRVDQPGTEPADVPADDLSSAIADLQRLLDDWWRAELANSDELLGRASETAELVKSLARIEAGEVLVAADVPSTLPPPSPLFHDRMLLPDDVVGTLTDGAGSDLLSVCDSLLRVLGVDTDPDEASWAPPAAPLEWAAPVAEPWLPPTSPSPAAEIAAGTPVGADAAASVAAEVAPAPEDQFHRFWGEGPEPHRGRGHSIIRQAVVSMLAFTGVIALVMALIG